MQVSSARCLSFHCSEDRFTCLAMGILSYLTYLYGPQDLQEIWCFWKSSKKQGKIPKRLLKSLYHPWIRTQANQAWGALSSDNTASKWLVHCVAHRRTDCRHLPASCDVWDNHIKVPDLDPTTDCTGSSDTSLMSKNMQVSIYPNLETQFTYVNTSTTFHLRKCRVFEVQGWSW